MVAIIDDELARLPERYRLPVLLCGLDGMEREDAAARLGWSLGTLRGRLERGRELLRRRLSRRGLTAPAVLAASTFAAPADAVPPDLITATTSRFWPWPRRWSRRARAPSASATVSRSFPSPWPRTARLPPPVGTAVSASGIPRRGSSGVLFQRTGFMFKRLGSRPTAPGCSRRATRMTRALRAASSSSGT
jgi:hypothetical protein